MNIEELQQQIASLSEENKTLKETNKTLENNNKALNEDLDKSRSVNQDLVNKLLNVNTIIDKKQEKTYNNSKDAIIDFYKSKGGKK